MLYSMHIYKLIYIYYKYRILGGPSLPKISKKNNFCTCTYCTAVHYTCVSIFLLNVVCRCAFYFHASSLFCEYASPCAAPLVNHSLSASSLFCEYASPCAAPLVNHSFALFRSFATPCPSS